jgi:succinyl-CoA synthetase beta subunit
VAAAAWLAAHPGARGEEVLELLRWYGIDSPAVLPATTADQAVGAAETIGYPVVMKVVSLEALHKSEVGGVMVGLATPQAVREAFAVIAANLAEKMPEAIFAGVRVMAMAAAGHDMFVGGRFDQSFGPVVFFGYGGIYVEVFNDTQLALCPVSMEEIHARIERLSAAKILKGTRGQKAADIGAYVELIARVGWLLADFPAIRELDLNPVRLVPGARGGLALDARAVIDSAPAD